MRFWLQIIGWIGLIFFVSCAPHTKEEVSQKVDRTMSKIIEHLSLVNSKEAFQERAKEIRSEFNQLVELLILFDQLPSNEGYLKHSMKGTLLEKELNRVRKIEGVLPLLEEAQRDALHKLDRYDKTNRLKKDQFQAFSERRSKFLYK